MRFLSHLLFKFNYTNMTLDLNALKKHLYVDTDDDDDYITTLYDVAEQIVLRHLHWSYMPDVLPSPVRHAVYLMVGQLYKNREITSSVSQIELPKAYDYLLSAYINYGPEEEEPAPEPAPEEPAPDNGGLDAEEVQQVQTALNEILS